MRKFIVWHNTKSEYGDGSWAIIDGMVFVRTGHGQKATQIGGSNPEGLARILIRELAGDCLTIGSTTATAQSDSYVPANAPAEYFTVTPGLVIAADEVIE